jgi:hypothetical protein
LRTSAAGALQRIKTTLRPSNEVRKTAIAVMI